MGGKVKVTDAVLLLSGGLDSTTVAALLSSEKYSIRALTLNYGQRHSKELESAKRVARYYSVEEHIIIDLDLSLIGGSALTDSSTPLPAAGAAGIPSTYVPARNTVFLSIALGLAEARGCRLIYTGVNAVDYSGYPDCRPEFIDEFNRLSAVATKVGVEKRAIKVIAPLIKMEKSDIVRLGKAKGAPYELTWSCYKGGKRACGVCDSCVLRLKGFRDAGIEDPVEYENK